MSELSCADDDHPLKPVEVSSPKSPKENDYTAGISSASFD